MATIPLPQAVENGEAALNWFDSIHGDRDAGRVLIDYYTLRALTDFCRGEVGD